MDFMPRVQFSSDKGAGCCVQENYGKWNRSEVNNNDAR